MLEPFMNGPFWDTPTMSLSTSATIPWSSVPPETFGSEEQPARQTSPIPIAINQNFINRSSLLIPAIQILCQRKQLKVHPVNAAFVVVLPHDVHDVLSTDGNLVRNLLVCLF